MNWRRHGQKKKKDKKTKSDLQNIKQKSKHWATWNTTKNCGWTQVLRKGNQLFCLIFSIVNMCIHYLVLINVKHKWKLKTGSNVYTYTAKPVLRGQHLGRKINWSFKTGNFLKEVKFIWNFLWQVKKNVTFQYRSLLNRGDRMVRLDCTSKHIGN